MHRREPQNSRPAGGIALWDAASCCVEALRREALGPGSVNYWACQDGGTAKGAAEQQEQCKEEPNSSHDELRGACQVRAIMPSIAGPDQLRGCSLVCLKFYASCFSMGL